MNSLTLRQNIQVDHEKHAQGYQTLGVLFEWALIFDSKLF